MSGKCPVDHSSFIKKTSSSVKVDTNPELSNNTSETEITSTQQVSKCPVKHQESELNPLNMMPNLSQEMAPGQDQTLPTKRIQSSIPKNEAGSTWEYPSPQQFYNALKRKGWETPVNEIETMVDIHNFLNEGCWDQVLKWESKYHCDCKDIKLIKFQGRPTYMTPKARMYGWVYGVEKPFDRHDWYVDRCGEQVRYVIDYYSAAPDEHGNPAFSVDVRPAVDSPSAAFDRTREVVGEFYENIKNFFKS